MGGGGEDKQIKDGNGESSAGAPCSCCLPCCGCADTCKQPAPLSPEEAQTAFSGISVSWVPAPKVLSVALLPIKAEFLLPSILLPDPGSALSTHLPNYFAFFLTSLLRAETMKNAYQRKLRTAE